MHARSSLTPARGRATFDSARYSALLPDATVTGISPSRPLSSQFRSDVLHPQDLDLLLAGGRAHLDDVASEGAHERSRDGRDPADMTAAGIDLVDAHDLDRALLALGVGVGDGGAEEDLVGLGPLGGIDHLRALQPLAEEADAPVDLAQPLLAVEIVAILRAVA